MSILSSLNPEQRRAVETTKGPVLILAGAGSGKTKTLTHRIAYLITCKGVSPHNILAVTFTNKASQEMRERLHTLLNNEIMEPQMPFVGTFHALCVKILRSEIVRLGYNQSFTIFDDSDQQSLVKQVAKELEIDTDQFTPRSLLSTISTAKNALLDPQAFSENTGGYYEEIVSKVYTRYQARLHEHHALDFNDLIRLTVILFRDHADILEKYQKLFQYILVDEYQDTNHAQYMLVTMLAKKNRNIFAIGDDYQMIYSWRNANIENILNFEKDYPDTTIITLEQNYRSTQSILDAAGHIISKNPNQRHKKLWTNNEVGQPLTLFNAQDEKDEAFFVADTIRSLTHHKNRSFSDFVVLYRTNAQSRVIEEVFLKRNIPYRIIGGIKFYQRKEVKDMIAYLRLLENGSDSVSLERVVNEPRRGVGPKTLSLWHSFAQNSFGGDFILSGVSLFTNPDVIPSSRAKSIISLCEFILQIREEAKTTPLSQLFVKIFTDSGYEQSLNDGTPEGNARIENVQELFSLAKSYNKHGVSALRLFLEDVALSSDTDSVSVGEEAVHLMTVHSAKGLEFPFVFLIGMEEGLLPHSRAALSQHDMEEERRLLYVGVTRARQHAYLSFARHRLLFGSTQMNPPSRFLDDIPQELLEHVVKKHSSRNLTGSRSSFRSQKKSATFSDGDKVHHDDFGSGIIVSHDETTLTIVFAKHGIKKLLTSAAPLEKL
ncbi:MAG: UvrD-helicase domain-containing protein [Candidatus Moranbacteria bacterium]|nr:UvrD-helicase domain-containing protein [Candidatus Moranbacteria bacterium]